MGGGRIGKLASAPAPGFIVRYDPSVASSITASSGAVSQLNDLSGNAHHLVQATAGKKPTTGTRTINSLNGLDYVPGSQQFLAVAFNQNCPITIFGVVKADATGLAVSEWFGAGPDVATATTPVVFQEAGNWAYHNGTDQQSATAVDTSAHVTSTIFDASAGQMWLDGASIKTGNAGTVQAKGVALGGSPLGAGSFLWDGIIAEVLMYGSALSTADRQQTEAYLKVKWGTP